MKKINLEKINKKLLTKYIRYVESMSEYKSFALILCFDINIFTHNSMQYNEISYLCNFYKKNYIL